ncbi:cellulase family glycosylhydrolase [Antrihabitans stalactiti]|uniref:Glycoside hydrolase family 5 domain-containing protein n=1 Tax=Antrihabitans stalactiti TaxID=2584121 RepID=A0A848KQ97_9NOCA|nr:cellulase family glycosylhydrolase [Antrihabitans stalactiti]NMN97787.1 hypothetical protein [Antrihabitans stalactiti]
MAPGLVGVTAVTTTGAAAASQTRDFQAVTNARFKAVRLSIEWPDVENVKGVFNWATTDQKVNAAAAAGLNILGLLTYTPAWAATAEGRNFIHPAPADPATFANFVKLAAQRYKGSIKNWEIWNEPNIQASFAPKPDPAKYTTMLKLSYAAIKAVDSSATVISGGLSPSMDDGTNISPYMFVQYMYWWGAKGSLDGLGIHPYSAPGLLSQGADWNSSKNAITVINWLLTAFGDGGRRLWTTEFGAPTSATQPYGVTEARQSEILVDGINYLRSLPNAGPIFLFDFRDLNTGSPNVEFNFGLVRTDYSPKPSLAAVQAMLGA